METFLIRALQLIMSLSLLVIYTKGDIFSLPVFLKYGSKSFVYSLTLGSLFLSSNPRRVILNMLLAGCRWEDMSRSPG